MAEEILINVGIGGESIDSLSTSVDNLGKSIENTGKDIEKLGKTTKDTENKQESLRSQIRKGREELTLMTRGTAEYAAKLQEVAAKQATFNRINKELKASQATLGQTMTNVNSTVGGLAGGFSVATGVMSLFGIESDGAMKSLVKMQALMSITSGLQSLNQGVRAFEALKLVFSDVFKSAAASTGAITELSQVNQVAANSSANLAKEAGVIGSNLAGANAVTTASNNLQETSNIIKAQGIMVTREMILTNEQLILSYLEIDKIEKTLALARKRNDISTVAGLEAKKAALFKNIEMAELSMSQEEILTNNVELNRRRVAIATTYLTNAELDLALARERGKSNGFVTHMEEQRVTSARERLAQANIVLAITESELTVVKQQALIAETEEAAATEANTIATNTNTTANKANGDAIESNGVKILKQIGNLIKFAAIIGLAIWAISSLIEWLNKIPKDVEIKLKLEENAGKGVTKIQEDISKVYHDLNTILNLNSEIGKDKLKNVDDFIVKNNIATQKQIDDLHKIKGATLKNYKELLDAKLKMTEAEAYDEALIKLRTEKRVEVDINKAKIDELTKQLVPLRQKMKEAGGGGIGLGISMSDTQKIYKLTSLLDDAKEAALDASEQLNTLLKVPFKSPFLIKSENKEDKGGASVSSGGVSGGLGATYKDAIKELEQYKKDFEVEYTQYLGGKRTLTEEEISINNNLRDKTNSFYSSTEREKLKYHKRDIDARLNDLKLQMFAQEESIRIAEGTRNGILEASRKTINDLDIQFEKKKKLYNSEIDAQNLLNKNIVKKEKEIADIVEKANKSKDESVKNGASARIKSMNAELDILKKQRDDRNRDLAEQLKGIEDLQKAKDVAVKEMNDAIKSGADITTLQNKIDDINSQIIDASAEASQTVRDLWMNSFDEIDRGISQVGKSLSSLSEINGLMMQTIDNKTQHEKNQLELSNKYQKASSDEQEQMMYELDLANYNAKKKLFETQKKYDIGKVAIEAASSEMAAIKNFIENGGFMNPLAIGFLAAETATIAATSIASINEIASRSLDAPIPPKGSGGAGGGSSSGGSSTTTPNIALNPSKNVLTSKEDNLNTMLGSNMNKEKQTVVKVSDINNVQKTVSVRDNNVTF